MSDLVLETEALTKRYDVSSGVFRARATVRALEAVSLSLAAGRYRRSGQSVPWRIRAPLKLADGLESMLRPLARLRVPVAHITTVLSITLMFIPGILDQSHKLVRAQMARGADLESANLWRRVKSVLPVLVPLFVKVFHDADELAVAMDARAYAGGMRRTRLYPLKIHVGEAVLTALFVAACVGILFIP